MVIGLIIGLRITADQQRPEQTGGRRCETIPIGKNDNSREKMQNVRGDSSALLQASSCVRQLRGFCFPGSALAGGLRVSAESMTRWPI